jgi:hypothetical protein
VVAIEKSHSPWSKETLNSFADAWMQMVANQETHFQKTFSRSPSKCGNQSAEKRSHAHPILTEKTEALVRSSNRN